MVTIKASVIFQQWDLYLNPGDIKEGHGYISFLCNPVSSIS